jgi:hypothetical protein
MLGNSNPLTTITCTIGTGGAPNNCTISVTWSEKAVSINTQSVNTTNAGDVRADLHAVREP